LSASIVPIPASIPKEHYTSSFSIILYVQFVNAVTGVKIIAPISAFRVKKLD